MGSTSTRVAHFLWAATCVVVSLLLVLTGRQGHPPAVVLLPLVFAAWAVGHGLIGGAWRLAAAGGRRGPASATGQPWPLGLRVAAVGTAAPTLVGMVQVVGSILTGSWYPFNETGEWALMLLVWLVHAACFAGLLLRRRWSRPLSAALAFAWAALLGRQIAEHFRSGSSDTMGLLIAVALMALLVAFGAHLLYSRRAKSFLGD